jgi:hypothetical protein
MTRRDWELYRERFRQLHPGQWPGRTECGLVRQFFVDTAMPVADGVVPIGYPVEDMEVRCSMTGDNWSRVAPWAR